MNKQQRNLIINSLLLVAGLMTAISGSVLQIGYHMGRLSAEANVWGASQGQWSDWHKVLASVFLILVGYHFWVHWKWYEVVLSRGLLRKNSRILILTLVMILVALTGLAPWLMDLMGADQLLRETMIEIHDKLAIILIIYLVLHLTRRAKWYVRAVGRR